MADFSNLLGELEENEAILQEQEKKQQRDRDRRLTVGTAATEATSGDEFDETQERKKKGKTVILHNDNDNQKFH